MITMKCVIGRAAVLVVSITSPLFQQNFRDLLYQYVSSAAGMKYDVRRIEEVYYDVKIRGLTASGDSTDDKTNQEQQGAD